MASKIRILVVDDDKEVCEFLRSFLLDEGFRVKALTDSKKVMEELKKDRYHLVILDLKMPKPDGVELMHQIRKHDSDLIVIVLTAFPSVETAVETMKQKAFDYLQKPFNVDELRQVILDAVRAKGLLTDLEDRLNMEIGRRVRDLRQEQKLTLKQLAGRTGLSVSLISQIELAKSAASISTLYKIVTALGVSFSVFFDGVK
jgi:two-component system OmpR family response regulator